MVGFPRRNSAICRVSGYNPLYFSETLSSPVWLRVDAMSDLDGLIVTFQRQLSDVLDTVVKTAMYEVTRLVEDNFLEEVKRRTQQVDTLMRQLKKASGREEEELGTTEMLTGDSNKDGAPLERQMGRRRCELSAPSLVTGSKGVDLILAANVKTEEDEQWCDPYHGEAGPCEARRIMTEGKPAAAQCEKMTPSCRDQNPQISSTLSSVQENSHKPSEPTQERNVGRDFRITVKHAGRLHHQNPGGDWEGGPQVSRPKKTEDVSSEAEVKVHIRRDVSKSSDTRLQSTDAASVPIKKEIVVDQDSCKDSLSDLRNTKSSCPVDQIRIRLDEPKQCHEVQDRLTRHTKVAAGFEVQQYKNPRKTFSNIAALSQYSVVTLSPPRIPCSSKPSSTSALSGQPVQLHDKQTGVVNRTAVPWVLNRTQNLLLHTDSHSIQRHPLRCGQCGKCFPHPSNLKAHLRIHSGERPFCCSLCGRGFTKLSNLKAHRRVHTGEKPYCCLGCGKRFTQNCNLKRHQRVCGTGREGNV
ncbi:zinc finger protein 774-like isoform X1 [Synchiropus splendidus]|uniref:zinc finger protein 774-like isoform X1 n=1 Tax=Synchiropus splendidus TaxID=270530 RepID=UPI00237EC7A5|nr:zinc finger protein 774-like isoform X1 [Synchiropus splendidus]